MRGLPLVFCFLFLGGCSETPADSSVDESGAATSAAAAGLPQHLGIGQVATAEEIAVIDIDIMPDGTGLPPGSGTAAHGARIYEAKCAACHGTDGQGTEAAGALVGRTPDDAFDFANSIEEERAKTIGNYWAYATTLYDYIRRSMPFDRPGSLTDEEVYALVAHLLHQNDIIPEDAVIDAETLPQVAMPARDRFERDDRETSTRVK